jgi:hypothetical protein
MKGRLVVSANSQLVTPTDRMLHGVPPLARGSHVEIRDPAADTLELPRPRLWLTFALVAIACAVAAAIGVLVRLGLDQRLT